MKRLLACLVLLSLLLTACGDAEGAAAASAEAPALPGVWINEGQYSEGRDFVETLTLRADGSAVVHLDYQGRPYADLAGSWTAAGDTLSVDFSDPNTRDRTYSYTLTETTLTLTGSGKEVVYRRQK